MDSVLRPRDIQARIRAGETPEDVAAAAQTSVDRIMGFATPVLAERAYQAELAQKASVRRRAATGPVGHLGQAVEAFLEPHGLGADDVEWDAWRREDGRWTVLATYLSGAAQQTARFTYDTGGRFVVADNDEARTLVGERSTETSAPEGDDETPGEPVYSSSDSSEGQLALGDDTLGMVLGRAPSGAAAGPSGSGSGLSTGLGTGSDVDESAVDDAFAPRPDAGLTLARPAAPADDTDPVEEVAFAPRPDAPQTSLRPAAPVSDVPATDPAAAARADQPAGHEESGLGTEAIDRDSRAGTTGPHADESELTEDLTSAARATRPVTAPAGTGDADWMVTQASERPAPKPSPAADRAEPAPSHPGQTTPPTGASSAPVEELEEEALFAAPVARSEEPTRARRSSDPVHEVAPKVGSESASGALPEEEQSTVEAAETRAPARQQSAKSLKSRGRASVPSWDEIMFGTPKDQ